VAVKAAKSIYVSVYITVLLLSCIHSMYEIFNTGGNGQWWGSVIAVTPMLFFFIYLFIASTARTSRGLPVYRLVTALGAVLTLYFSAIENHVLTMPLIYSIIVGVIGSNVYVYWYSVFDRPENGILKVGNLLPDFTLMDESGKIFSARDFKRSPALFMFYRGNWCPLCMAQIKEILTKYKELHHRGVEVYLVSSQPHENTKALASKFDVPFHFLIDENNHVTRQLQLLNIAGTPSGMAVLGYEKDTTMPTVLMTDASGTLIFADLTDNYRIRPEPDTFLNVLDQHNITTAT